MRRARWSWSLLGAWASTAILALLVGVELVRAFIGATGGVGSAIQAELEAEEVPAGTVEQVQLPSQVTATPPTLQASTAAPVPTTPAAASEQVQPPSRVTPIPPALQESTAVPLAPAPAAATTEQVQLPSQATTTTLALQTSTATPPATAPVPPTPTPVPPTLPTPAPVTPAPTTPAPPVPSAPKARWRTDYRCGKRYPVADGTPAQCDPRNQPCCSGVWMGWCGSSAQHCNCPGCVDYRHSGALALAKKKMEMFAAPERRCPAGNHTPNYTSVFKELCCLGYDSGDGWGDEKLKECCRGLGIDARDWINRMMTPFIERPPLVPLQVNKRPRPLVADCGNPLPSGLKGLLTGSKRGVPAKFVDVTFLAHELDLLEIRLFELDADYVVVAEASYNFRGDKKALHFEASKARFAQFLPRVLHVNVDDCPEFQQAVQGLRQMDVVEGGQNVAERAQRLCIWKLAIPLLRQLGLPADALVHFSDIDEMPSGQFVHTLKHCEVKPAALPMQPSLRTLGYNLRARCPSSFGAIAPAQVVPWRQVDADGCINRFGECRVRPLKPPYPINKVHGAGAHYSSFGSMVLLDYKLYNHAEGGNFPPVVLGGLGFCDVTDQTLLERQQMLQDNPRKLTRFWEHRDALAQKGPIGREELEACDVSWVLIENPARYPFIFGDADENYTRHMLGLAGG